MVLSYWSSDVFLSDLIGSGFPGLFRGLGRPRPSDHPRQCVCSVHLLIGQGLFLPRYAPRCLAMTMHSRCRSLMSARSNSAKAMTESIKLAIGVRSEEHTSELQPVIRSSDAVYRLKQETKITE